MIARIVSRVAFWTAMAAAAAIPFVPGIYRWFYPPRTAASEPKGFWETVGAVLNSLNSIGDGIAIFVWCLGLTALVAITFIVAIIAAWRAQESRTRKLLCGLPVVLAVAMWGVLIFGL